MKNQNKSTVNKLMVLAYQTRITDLNRGQINKLHSLIKEAKRVASKSPMLFVAEIETENKSKKITLGIIFSSLAIGVLAKIMFENQQIFEIIMWIFIIMLLISPIISGEIYKYLLKRKIR